MGGILSRSGRLCRHSATLAVALLGLATCSDALAQTRGTWNVDADGLWSVTTNWLNNTVAGGVSGTATFANDITATRTVTLDSNRSLGAFIFGDSGTSTAASWIVTSSTITPANGTNNVLLTVNALGTGATATISSILATSTSPSIAKEGVGTLVLGATNNFTNKLAINAGTLQVSADRNLGAVGTFAADRITISDGAVLKTSTSFTLNANRGITVASGTGTLNINGGTLTLAAPVAGSGTMLVTGPNALTLQNASANVTSVNWDFSTNNGTRTFFEGANALGTGSVRVRSGVRLTSQNVTSGTLTNAVTLDSGAGLTARSTGGALTYTNVIFPTSGTAILNKDDLATAALTISSGGSLLGNLTIDTSAGGSNAVGNVILDGAFTGAGGLVKVGTGTSGKLILGGQNLYTGYTTVSTGTLALAAAGSIANSAGISVASGATFDVSAVAGYSLGAAQELNGAGTVLGAVTASGTIAPGSSGGVGTLAFANNLAMNGVALASYQLNGTDPTVGGAVNDLATVAGDFTLDGTLNVTETVPNSFLSANVGDSWRLFNYTGAFTNNGMVFGTMPALSGGNQFAIDTSTPNQVNLLVVVPEPATIVTAVLGLGGLGLAAVRRRRSRGRY